MKKENVSRREFMKAVGVAGVGSLMGAGVALAQTAAAPSKPGPAKVPMRAFGKTGVKVSMLSLGGMFDIPSNQLMLKQSIDWGVTYWDTAAGYGGGKSEMGIGMYLENNPDARKKLFLVTKSSGANNVDGMSRLLDQSLDRMKTDYVDLYFMHGISDPGILTPEIKAWAEQKKKAGKIKLFGFSTHKNMEDCLSGASKLGWIDGIMTAYSFRTMKSDAMKSAADACAKAGIGLTAMKTIGKGQKAGMSDADMKLLDHFVTRGFTAEQAKLKAVWENPQIAAACVNMASVSLLSANVAATLDKTQLTTLDKQALEQYARATRDGFCAGCAHRCGDAVADTMRCLMYYHGYDDRELARETFAEVAGGHSQRLAEMDYTEAERVCPHRMPIASLMREATEVLA